MLSILPASLILPEELPKLFSEPRHP